MLAYLPVTVTQLQSNVDTTGVRHLGKQMLITMPKFVVQPTKKLLAPSKVCVCENCRMSNASQTNVFIFKNNL